MRPDALHRRLVATGAPALAAALLFAGCGGVDAGTRAVALDWSRTAPPGRGPAFRPPPYGELVAARRALGTLTCGGTAARPYGVHLELFAAGRVVVVPAGIGMAPPEHRRGAMVSGARCAYPLRTVEPTGVIDVDGSQPGSRTPTVGDLFGLWGQPLDARRLAGFLAPAGTRVTAYVDGRPFSGDPRGIPLRRHAAIVLELGPHVQPHPVYAFAPGL